MQNKHLIDSILRLYYQAYNTPALPPQAKEYGV